MESTTGIYVVLTTTEERWGIEAEADSAYLLAADAEARAEVLRNTGFYESVRIDYILVK